MPQKSLKPTPMRVMEDLWAFCKSQALIAAVELDLPSHIAAGNRTAKQIAAAANASERGVEHLLDALVGLGYLNKKNSGYGLEPVSRQFLVRGKELYMGDMFDITKPMMEGWTRLGSVVKNGRPAIDVASEQVAKEFFPKLVSAIFPASFTAASAACRAIASNVRGRIKTILDVAAGSGAWSIPFAKALKGARVTVVDFPEVTRIARGFAEQWGVADRYDYLEGNLRELDFGNGRYDLVILGHIIHTEGPQWGKRLLEKSYAALKENGLLLIAEMVPNDTRTGPAFPLLFGLNMLIHTADGDVYTMREYRQWLDEAGFKKVKTIQAPAPSPLILATK
jgi:3-hydroxy-5-methyl-1-naphthoate 3-O-methyltransferase